MMLCCANRRFRGSFMKPVVIGLVAACVALATSERAVDASDRPPIPIQIEAHLGLGSGSGHHYGYRGQGFGGIASCDVGWRDRPGHAWIVSLESGGEGIAGATFP